jgi:hypothetical protein
MGFRKFGTIYIKEGKRRFSGRGVLEPPKKIY